MKNLGTAITKSFFITISLSMVLIVGCDKDKTPSHLPEKPNERLAFAIASALGDANVRESVHGAMDASPYQEHKLVFGQFLKDSTGSKFQQALAEELGGENKLNELLAELPNLDFYLPYETHRETWEHANGNLLVVCITDVDTTEAAAYHPDGSRQVLSSSQQIKEAEIAAMFTLHPTEKKIHRSSRTTAGGDQMKYESWKTRVNKLWNRTTDGPFGGRCEIFFRTKNPAGETHRSKTISIQTGSNEKFGAAVKDVSPAVWLHPDAATDTHPLEVTVMEDDGGLFHGGDDDNYGSFKVVMQGKYESDVVLLKYPKTEQYITVR
ncbi:hypothetical protein [Fodinibius halophilus]|uniref:Uncharacterized protein n=1 Tax=Fodinibius halophilus TaxID=1736908 RepID=A0A6M1TCC8_9BACT|nr:hypothetical protein [Fodinibius halophilus]NGP89651.1 hypothetical protein [Fodinibius halophilus]